jgi:hypothetical protein
MRWQAYRLVFRLESPLHIGWRRPGNLMQTRYYVPGRVFWGAVTANLARWLGRINYRQVGEWVQDNLRFGYFFPADDLDNPLYPIYSKEGVTYGRDKGLPEAVFERCFLSSLASTAIASQSNTGRDGSLHEVEFVAPARDTGKPVYLVGHLFVRTRTGDEETYENDDIGILIESDDIVIQEHSLYQQIIASLRIGGERRYGFGRLTLYQSECKQVNSLFDYDLNQENLYVTIPAHKPMLAHAMAHNMCIEGSIEPLLSREWVKEQGPGRHVTLFGLCYTPGSLVTTKTIFNISHYGIWKQEV